MNTSQWSIWWTTDASLTVREQLCMDGNRSFFFLNECNCDKTQTFQVSNGQLVHFASYWPVEIVFGI